MRSRPHHRKAYSARSNRALFVPYAYGARRLCDSVNSMSQSDAKGRELEYAVRLIEGDYYPKRS